MTKICYKCGHKKKFFEKFHSIREEHLAADVRVVLDICDKCFKSKQDEILDDIERMKQTYAKFALIAWYLDDKLICTPVTHKRCILKMPFED